MPYYQKHVFICTNERDNGRKCCQDAQAKAMRDYAKKQIQQLGLTANHHARINIAGCLGRCQEGPILVIYPAGIWYTYHSQADIDEIIMAELVHNQRVTRLLLPQN